MAKIRDGRTVVLGQTRLPYVYRTGKRGDYFRAVVNDGAYKYVITISAAAGRPNVYEGREGMILMYGTVRKYRSNSNK